MSPLDLTAAYSMFPGGGQVVRPRGIVDVLNGDDAEVFNRGVDRQRIVSEQSAFQMVTMLEDVIERGTGTSVRTLGVRGPLGGKTGTTDDYRDAWFVGFSSSVVVGVWVGFDQPAPIGPQAYGARVALPIWADFMKRLAARRPAAEFAVPDGLESVELCNVSYLRPVDGAPRTRILQGRRSDSNSTVSHSSGNLRQRAARAVGACRSLGRAIGILH